MTSAFITGRVELVPTESVWECADGRRLPLSMMERKHIQSCIDRILRSEGLFRGEWLHPLRDELERRKNIDRTSNYAYRYRLRRPQLTEDDLRAVLEDFKVRARQRIEEGRKR